MSKRIIFFTAVIYFFLLFFLAFNLYASGARQRIIALAAVPIDPAPFSRGQDYDLRELPNTLLDETDNAFYEVYRRLGQSESNIRQIIPLLGDDEKQAFHSNLRDRNREYFREFSVRHNPMINVLFAFELFMDPGDIEADKAKIKIHAFYTTRENSDDASTYHRNEMLEIEPNNYQDVKQKIFDAVYKMISQYINKGQ